MWYQLQGVKSLLEKGHLSQDCILLVGEIYLQKRTQLHSGEYIGANENKGIMVFMITGLKNPVSSVVKACPEVTVNGEWLSQEILKCLFHLMNSVFFLLGPLLQTVIQSM